MSLSRGGGIAGNIFAGIAFALIGLILNPAIIQVLLPTINFFNKAWFRVVIIVVCFTIIAVDINLNPPTPTTPTSVPDNISTDTSSQVSNKVSSQPVSSETISSEESSKETPVDSEILKQTAIETDKMIFDYVEMAEKNYENILATLESADTVGIFNVYEKIKDALDASGKIASSIDRLKTDENADYVDSASTYIFLQMDVYRKLIKYIDKEEMKYLSDAKESMTQAGGWTIEVVAKRMEYLMLNGVSDEEIVEIFEGGTLNETE